MRSCVPLTILLLLPAFALAQQTTGSLEGRVVDANGQPLAGVEVTVTGASLLGPRTSTTSADGLVRVPALPVGSYQVSLRHAQYAEVLLESIDVRLGRTTSLGRIVLGDQPHAVEEMIVHGTAIDPTATEFGGYLSSDMLDDLPTERDHLAAAAYLPHVNSSFFGDGINIAGSTGAENAYFIDGVNVTDPHFASGGMSLPQSFVRAIEVKAGGYQAEYGRSSGGIINVVTHSGSNEFQAQAFGFFTNNNFSDGKRVGYFEPEQDEFSRYDLGLSVGGPVVRDKLWYFAAYDPRIDTRDLQYPGLEVLEDHTTIHSFAGKLDWQADPRSRVTLTLLGDPSQRDALMFSPFLQDLVPTSLASADPVSARLESGAISLSLEGNRLIGERGLLEGRVYRVQRRADLSAATERGASESMFLDRRTGLDIDGGYGYTHDYSTHRTGASVKGTAFWGTHVAKAGLEYEDIFLDAQGKALTPDGLPGYISRLPDEFLGLMVDLDTENRLRIPSAFVQDSWSITDQLELNAGVRWDGLSIVDFKGETTSQINDQFQPRAGFTYRMGEAGSQRVFGSYGRFFEQVPMLAVQYHFGSFEQAVLFYHDVDPRTAPAVPDTFDVAANIAPPADELHGPHFDEFVLGYETEMGTGTRIGVRGIYRELKEALEDSFTPDGLLLLANPGRGELAAAPRPRREYAALEFSVAKSFTSSSVSASYVLSRNYGNYPGAYPTDNEQNQPHRSEALWYPEQYAGDGPLPNDRTHSFKLYGFHARPFGLTMGGFFSWQSGTPLSDMVRLVGFTQGRVYESFAYLDERGSEGRTPSIWDLNLRFAYELPFAATSRTESRLLLDVFHLFSQREPTAINQTRLTKYDPETGEGNANPLFGQVIAYQPPMTIRLGIETKF